MTIQNPRLLQALGVVALVFSTALCAVELTFEQALIASEHYSAEISANQHQANALQNRADSATQLPDPKLKLGLENVPIGGSNQRRLTREGMTTQRIGISQEYISSQKRDRKADTIRAEARQTAANTEVIRARLQQEVAQAWLDFALTEKTLQEAKVLVSEAEKQITLQRAGVANGAQPSTVVDAQLVVVSMQDKITIAQRDHDLAGVKLTRLTGLSVDKTQGSLPHFEHLPAALTTLQEAVQQHPEVLQAHREADLAKARSAESDIAAIPNTEVEVYYAKRSEEYEDLVGVLVSVDLPLFKSQRQDKEHAADLSRAMEANDQLTLKMRERQAELNSRVAQYQAAQILWRRQVEEIIPLQQQRQALILAQYSAGKADLLSVLEARRAVLENHLNASNTARELAQLWASIRYLIPQESAQ